MLAGWWRNRNLSARGKWYENKVSEWLHATRETSLVARVSPYHMA